MTYEEKAEYLADLLHRKMGVGGRGLEARLRRARRRLPRRIRREAELFAEAARLQANPRLARMADPERLDAAFRAVESYLDGIDRWQRRKDAALALLSVNAFNLLVLAALLVAFLRWRGLL